MVVLAMTRRVRRNEAEAAALAELEALYREVDAAYEGWSCPASTDCCRFGVTGREPYVTSIELALIRKAITARGGRAPSKATRTLPMAGERRCPLLSDEGRCSIYASRPLGCRTFFCERADSSGASRKTGRAEVAAFVRQVQAIAAKHETDGDRGRPLTRAL
jgi:Fe-S-cluster containining protein